jgi:hypothetical protein
MAEHELSLGRVFSVLPFTIKVSSEDYDTLWKAGAEEDVTVTDLITGGVLTIRQSKCGICDRPSCALVLTRWIKKGAPVKYEENLADYLIEKGYTGGLAEREKAFARYMATLPEFEHLATYLVDVAK